MQRREHDDPPTGTGPGITGASGDLIDGTGTGAGIGGTGHDDEAQATGQHPDERQLPSQQDAMEQNGGVPRPGTIGGGGPEEPLDREEAQNPGRPGGDGIAALGDAPGGIRKVGEE